MTPEQKRREKFLRDHGSLPKREQRERFLQRQELKARCDGLRAQIDDFDGSTNPGAIALRNAWKAELVQKLELLLKVTRGELVSRAEIEKTFEPVRVIRQAVRETAMRF